VSSAATESAPATTADPQRLAFWVAKLDGATALMRAVSECPEIVVHIYATTPPLGAGDGTVAAAVCPEHGAALDFDGVAELGALSQTVADAFAVHGYRTAGGPP
jgi:hypothetical protein